MYLLSKSRYRATVLLSFGILFTGLIDFLYTHYRPSQAIMDSSVSDRRMLDSLFALLPAEENFEQDDYPHESFQVVSNNRIAELHLHSFDPNKVAEKEWVSMGLPLEAFRSLDRYRSKGGKIRVPEQMMKVRRLDSSIARQLVSLVKIDSSLMPARKQMSFVARAPKLPEPRFDINLADSNQLKKVFGIGSKTAARILRYRDNLGGFLRMDQLYEVFGLDSLVIEDLMEKSFLSNKPEIKTLNPNTATEEELSLHPYIRRNLARLIVRYRNQHPPYSKPEDLLGIRLIRPEQVEKIRPYLRF